MTTGNPPLVERLHAEYEQRRSLHVVGRTPRLSWTTVTDAPGWFQAAYEVEIDGSPLRRRGEGEDKLPTPWSSVTLGPRV